MLWKGNCFAWGGLSLSSGVRMAVLALVAANHNQRQRAQTQNSSHDPHRPLAPKVGVRMGGFRGGKGPNFQGCVHQIHRIASTPESHGVFRRIIEYALSVSGNLRIDTHRDNRIMRRLIEKAGFSYCGVIVLADGSERLAYQKITQR